MASINTEQIKELNNNLKNIVKEIGISEIEPDEKEITKFCQLINDENLIYLDDTAAVKAGFEGKIIPPGYAMNLSNPLIQKVFLKGGSEVFSRMKGLIHVSSVIELLKPMVMKNKYKLTLETSDPVKKSGKKGIYYSIIFKVSVLDENNVPYAVDNHEFFFKV